MKKVMTLITLVALVISLTGCASMMSYNASKREIMGERVMASGNDAAIKAFASGDTVGIGVNVLASEALTKHPFRQLGAAILDAGLIYGLYEGVQELNQDNDHGGERNLNISTTGDGNTYNINTGDAATSNADENTKIQGDSNQDSTSQ